MAAKPYALQRSIGEEGRIMAEFERAGRSRLDARTVESGMLMMNLGRDDGARA